MNASFWGLFKTNFYGRFRKLFVFTKFKFYNIREKVINGYLNILIFFYQVKHLETQPD